MNAPGSAESIASAKASVVMADRMLSARRGPTPLMPMSASKAVRASSVGKPYSVMLSSRTCSDVNSLTRSPAGPSVPEADSGMLARMVTPPTDTSAQSGPTPASTPSSPVIIWPYSMMSRWDTSPALMWHMATARASDASVDGVSLSPSRTRTISCTCSLELPP